MFSHRVRSANLHSKSSANSTLKMEWLEPRWLMASNFLNLVDSTLATLTQTLYNDGSSISRSDMIAIFNSIKNESDGTVDTTDLQDLKTIVSNAKTLNMANYVYVLSYDIVYGNTANKTYLGSTLGNLAAGNTNSKLGCLVNKWFYGTDLPVTGGYSYTTVSGTLYGTSTISHLNEKQGSLGDCYLISTLGSIADSCPTAIKNMIINNGDGTWTVRFYSSGKADYVTVNDQLPVTSSGKLIFNGYGASATSTTNVLWLSLIEKAYAQWNETGKTLQGNYLNSYVAIAGGWMGNVYQQVLGTATNYYKALSTTGAQSSLITALTNGQAVTIGTTSSPSYSTTGLYGSHAYNVLSYNSSTGLFTLYNPWGSSQPKQLTWAQLLANCTAFASSVSTSTTAAATTAAVTATVKSKALVSATRASVNAASTTQDATPAAATQSSQAQPDEDQTAWDENPSLFDAAFRDSAESARDIFAEIDGLIDEIGAHLDQLCLMPV